MSTLPRLLDGWTVLVADDEPDSLDVARRLLVRAGAAVITATNGAEALDRIHHHKFDCVLSDISMPEMDGWMLIDALNNSRATSSLPAIALTAHAMPGDRQKAIERGFVNYITKPLDARKFIDQLVTILVDVPELAHRFADPLAFDPGSAPPHRPNAADPAAQPRHANPDP